MRTESELIARALRRDSVAFLDLFEKYQPIVFKLQGMYYLKDLEPEDWRQEGQLVFFKTLKVYDSSLKVALGLFYRINFERYVCSLLRKQGAEKRKLDLYASSLDEKLEKHGEAYVYREYAREDVSYGYVQLRETLAVFHEGLSSLEYQVFCGYLSCETNGEISSRLKISEKQVNNAMDRVKHKFKETIDG